MNQIVVEIVKLFWKTLSPKGKVAVCVAGVGTVGLVGYGAYTTVNNCISRAARTVETVSDRACTTVDNAVGKVSNCADHAVDKTSEVLKYAIDSRYEVETPAFKLRPTTESPRGIIGVAESPEVISDGEGSPGLVSTDS